MTEVNRKEMLAGLFLSKFDITGLSELGFSSWNEAYNTLALAVHGRPLSVKGYRDEFDPFFDNPRKGWHKRPAHQNRLDMMDEYCDLSLEAFAELVRTQFAVDGHDLDAEIGNAVVAAGVKQGEDTPCAKRMVTGLAAENYFADHYREHVKFADCLIERTTALGCGFDFKLMPPKEKFLGVEVKGMAKFKGQVMLTEKEFRMAEYLKKRFYLYVVSGFSSNAPRPIIVDDPLSAGITFEEKTIEYKQKVWVAKMAAA